MKDEEGDSYYFILILFDRLMKFFCYKLIKTIINTIHLAKVIFHIIIRDNNCLDFILGNKNMQFSLKF